MRVLVACDALAGLSPQAASELIGQAFADQAAQVAVVPLADGGDWLALSISAWAPTAQYHRPVNLDECLGILSQPGELVLDLTTSYRPSLAELISAATPQAIAKLRQQRTGGTTVAVVPPGEAEMPLTGLAGVLAEQGRREGAELAHTLAENDRGQRWTGELGIDGAAAGTGAVAGIGALVLALGGRIATGLELGIEGFNLKSVMAKADVVVTGAAQLDFHAVGGELVKRIAALATETLRPVIAIVGRNFVSARELRLAGIEAAYPVLPGAGEELPTPQQLSATAQQVARSWQW